MKISHPFSCILLLSIGACFPLDNGQGLEFPGEELEAMLEQPDFGGARRTPKRHHSPQQGFSSLFSLAQEPQGFGKDKTGTRFRFGRQQGGREDKKEAVNSLPAEDGEKRAGGLQSLAEELNGYHRKKGGFSFRFGRRGRRTRVWENRETLSCLCN
ncbi:orexigenic neuropeptide QRFP [Sceloporus undulatus]|uniref:orexigenic neuropeptide QRFP n=1 Tax=Sceloporus undulatus TaxID=8520 RepID=UPI001C4C9BEA|nr:orexigenic neuropeptide QRFP [Sceloporus undulatus]